MTFRWIDREDDYALEDRLALLNRIVRRLVLAVWLAVLGYVVALAWMGM